MFYPFLLALYCSNSYLPTYNFPSLVFALPISQEEVVVPGRIFSKFDREGVHVTVLETDKGNNLKRNELYPLLALDCFFLILKFRQGSGPEGDDVL